MKMQWILDKYIRLRDTRNSQMTIDRGPQDHLLLQFDESLKMLYVYHNGTQLEELFIHPLVFSHDFIIKDQQMLFSIKSQNDGNVLQKFRLRFSSLDAIGHFCAKISKFISIKSYVEGSSRSRRSSSGASSVDLSNTPINLAHTQESCSSSIDIKHSRPIMADLSFSILQNCSSSQDSQLSHQSFQNLKPILRSHSTGDFGQQQPGKEETMLPVQNNLTNVATQTDIVNNENVVANPNPVSVHVHVGNLFSMEAAQEFGKVLRHFTHRKNGTNMGGGGGCMGCGQAKKVKEKDPNMPKKPLNPYMLWLTENRAHILMEEGTNGKRRASFWTNASKSWNALPAEEKEMWKQRSAENKLRYQEEIAAYTEMKKAEDDGVEPI